MLKLVLALACVSVAASAGLKAKAKKDSFLFQLQTDAIEMYDQNFPGGQISDALAVGLNMAETDFCKINNVDQQDHNSIFFGPTCKAEFVTLYNQEPDRCGGVFCNVVRSIKDNTAGFIEEFVLATSDRQAFDLIKERIVDPVFGYTCRCALPMMDAWISCKHSIGDAQVFDLLQLSGAFDTSADYLGGSSFKNYWINMLANRINFDNIRDLLERVTVNMCEDNAQGGGQCYEYFYRTVAHLYQWYLKTVGLRPSPSKRGPSSITEEFDEECTRFDLTPYMAADYVANFTSIKEAVVDKFCVAECSDLYQQVLFGCCTATMIQDTDLSDAVLNVADDVKELVLEIYPEQEEEISALSTEYLDYAAEVMAMLREPTCDNGVSYDVTPCADWTEDTVNRLGTPCEGLSGKKLKKCEKKNPIDAGGADASPCAGLKGKKLKKCEKKEKKKNKNKQNA